MKIKELIKNLKKDKKRNRYKYPQEISWDIGYSALEFLEVALRYFIEDAPKIIDFEDRILEIFGETKDYLKTVEELYDRVVWLKLNYENRIYFTYQGDKAIDYMNEYQDVLSIFAQIAPYLWW